MKHRIETTILAISAQLQLAACATAPEHIGSAYVSPIIYSDYNCHQISIEMQRVSFKVREVTGQQHSKAINDDVAMGVGLVLFWPALFLLAMGSDHKAELESLKGEYDALNEAAIQKQCTATRLAQSANAPLAAEAKAQPELQVQLPPNAPLASGSITDPSRSHVRECVRYAYRVVSDPTQDQCAAWSK